MHPIITHKKAAIIELCQQNQVENLYLFGSINTQAFNEDSDIDILVTFKLDEMELEDYVDYYFNLQFSLESLLDRTIDLVTERSIKNPFFKQTVIQSRVLLYQAKRA